MEYLALASDYDGTLAKDGVVAEATIAALVRLRQAGRKVILVTGRELPDLESVFPRLELLDCVVGENGALVYWPASGKKCELAEPPPPIFLETLRRRGVQPLSVGDVIIATSRPNETEIIKVIGDLGLELHVIFNKSSVMILPSGVTKMTGLAVVLGEMKLSEHNVVGVGDAENDHAFLKFCGMSVAVANAIPALKEAADLVTTRSHGAGVVELIGRILAGDLAAEAAVKRR
jgi:hydroxymethylpyrimidine pyrophosphatase-like HAD family hydrolase